MTQTSKKTHRNETTGMQNNLKDDYIDTKPLQSDVSRRGVKNRKLLQRDTKCTSTKTKHAKRKQKGKGERCYKSGMTTKMQSFKKRHSKSHTHTHTKI